MEDRQKWLIYGGVVVAVVFVVIFYIANFNFIMDGGFAETKKVDGAWDGIKDNLVKTMGAMKNELAGSKKASSSSTAEQVKLLKIMIEKIETATPSVTTSVREF